MRPSHDRGAVRQRAGDLPPCSAGRRHPVLVAGGAVRVGERARQRQQPDAHRHERDELEQRERDESRREQHHACCEQADAEHRRAAEPATATRQRESGRHDGEEGQHQADRDEVMHDRAHRDGHESDRGQMQAGRDDRGAEGPARPATGRSRQSERHEDAVGSEEEAGEEHGGVEGPPREIGVRPQLREVEAPPHAVAGGEHREQHSERERKHGEAADPMRGGGVADCRGCRIDRRIDGIRGCVGGIRCGVGRVRSGVRGGLQRHVRGVGGRGEDGSGLDDGSGCRLRDRVDERHGRRRRWCGCCVGRGRGRHSIHDRFSVRTLLRRAVPQSDPSPGSAAYGNKIPQFSGKPLVKQ